MTDSGRKLFDFSYHRHACHSRPDDHRPDSARCALAASYFISINVYFLIKSAAFPFSGIKRIYINIYIVYSTFVALYY